MVKIKGLVVLLVFSLLFMACSVPSASGGKSVWVFENRNGKGVLLPDGKEIDGTVAAAWLAGDTPEYVVYKDGTLRIVKDGEVIFQWKVENHKNFIPEIDVKKENGYILVYTMWHGVVVLDDEGNYLWDSDTLVKKPLAQCDCPITTPFEVVKDHVILDTVKTLYSVKDGKIFSKLTIPSDEDYRWFAAGDFIYLFIKHIGEDGAGEGVWHLSIYDPSLKKISSPPVGDVMDHGAGGGDPAVVRSGGAVAVLSFKENKAVITIFKGGKIERQVDVDNADITPYAYPFFWGKMDSPIMSFGLVANNNFEYIVVGKEHVNKVEFKDSSEVVRDVFTDSGVYVAYSDGDHAEEVIWIGESEKKVVGKDITDEVKILTQAGNNAFLKTVNGRVFLLTPYGVKTSTEADYSIFSEKRGVALLEKDGKVTLLYSDGKYQTFDGYSVSAHVYGYLDDLYLMKKEGGKMSFVHVDADGVKRVEVAKDKVSGDDGVYLFVDDDDGMFYLVAKSGDSSVVREREVKVYDFNIWYTDESYVVKDGENPIFVVLYKGISN